MIDFTLGNSLFGAVKLTKNSDFDKYKYSEYGIGWYVYLMIAGLVKLINIGC